MQRHAIHEAATLLADARRLRRHIAPFRAALAPATVDDAHRIQDASMAELGDPVAGWKVSADASGLLMRGAIPVSRVFAHGSAVPAGLVPLMGVEAEIAFRFDAEFGPRGQDYSYGEIRAGVTAFPAIEIVDTRFEDYKTAPVLDRLADCMSNGGFVAGEPIAHWRSMDLAAIGFSLAFDGQTIAAGHGGHPTGDPMLRVVDLVNHYRAGSGVRAGQFVTTGTYSGLNHARAGQTVSAAFAGLPPVQISFS